jgi:hypothetical protein
MSSAGAWGIGSGSPTALFSMPGGCLYVLFYAFNAFRQEYHPNQIQMTQENYCLLPLNLCRKCFYTNPETILIYLES